MVSGAAVEGEECGTLESVHHIGVTVSDVDRALAFWEPFLGTAARWRRILDAPYLGRVTGYPEVRLDAAVVELPGGALLELLNYLVEDKRPNDPATAHPGNVHVCLLSEDIENDWSRAVALGAQPVSPGPVNITAGPNQGARGCYLRIHDGITLELFQTPK